MDYKSEFPRASTRRRPVTVQRLLRAAGGGIFLLAVWQFPAWASGGRSWDWHQWVVRPELALTFGVVLLAWTAIERLLSSRRRLRGRILGLEAELEKQVRAVQGADERAFERTRQLAQRLHEEQELRHRSEASTAAKSGFLASMSHEIRTPMTGILGMADLLVDTELDGDQREFTEAIRRSANSLLVVINDILDFSKIEAGKVDFDPAPFEVRNLLEDCLEMVARPAAEKGLELTVLIDPDLPAAFVGDASRIRQIVINLLSNAVKFTRTGQIYVSATIGQEAREYPGLRLSVVDTGIGIAPEKQRVLFDDYCQVHEERSIEGTGLGLAISRRLVEMMHGSISLESSVGQGSRFSVDMPLPLAELEADQAPLALRGRRVLVVSPHANTRLMLLQQMRHCGVRVSASNDAASAEASVVAARDEGEPYFAVLLDIHPLELSEGVRAELLTQTGTGHAAVVLADSVDRDRREAAEGIGFANALPKPVRQESLLRCLQAIASAEADAASGHAQDLQNAILTVVAASEPSISPAEEDPVSESQTASSAENRRVLIVDDNPVNRRVAQLMLLKAGYEISQAEDGQVALEMVRKEEAFAVILMDVNMPRLDGFEATAAIREYEGSSWHTPIIAMTASAMAGDNERCLQAGMDDYVSKPVRAENLLETVAEWATWSAEVAAVSEKPPAAGDESDAVSELTLDMSNLNDMRSYVEEEGDELVLELVTTFFSSAEERVAAMRTTYAEGDALELANAAHSLKGSAGTLGAPRLFGLCRDLEEFGRHQGLPPTDAAVEEISAELEALRHALEQELGETVI